MAARDGEYNDIVKSLIISLSFFQSLSAQSRRSNHRYSS